MGNSIGEVLPLYEDCSHPDHPSRWNDGQKNLEGYILSDVVKANSLQKANIWFVLIRKKAARRRLLD
jgi:hypothetical protein